MSPERIEMNPETVIAGFKNHQQALGMATATIEWQEFLLWRFFAWLDHERVAGVTDIDQKAMLRYQLSSPK